MTEAPDGKGNADTTGLIMEESFFFVTKQGFTLTQITPYTG